MDVAMLEQYIYSLQELKRKVLTRADELSMNNAPAILCPNMNNNTPLAMPGPTVLQHSKGPETNVLEGPNVLSLHGLNVFDDAWKNNNCEYYFDPALMINANVQGQGSVWMHPMYFVLFRFGEWINVVPTPYFTFCRELRIRVKNAYELILDHFDGLAHYIYTLCCFEVRSVAIM
nr:transcription factor, MADS-box [Tanacetum cinerariifolium]